MFQFKQFAVDQTGCAMKVNTDGVLLGALAASKKTETIFDIGTGTGVIALMLGQRFPEARIDAVEIESQAAATADENFRNSPFAERLHCHPVGFEQFFDGNPMAKYDLIVSNPPFYLDALKSPGAAMAAAKHTDEQFFYRLLTDCIAHLTPSGQLWMVLPLQTANIVQGITDTLDLYLVQSTAVHSFAHSQPHRLIVAYSLTESYLNTGKLIIYREPKVYSETYIALLRNFFTIF